MVVKDYLYTSPIHFFMQSLFSVPLSQANNILFSDYQPAFYLDFPPGQGWKTKKSIAHKGEFCLEKLAVSQSYELLFILHVFTVRIPKSFFRFFLFLEQELVLHQVSLALEGFAVLLLKRERLKLFHCISWFPMNGYRPGSRTLTAKEVHLQRC